MGSSRIDIPDFTSRSAFSRRALVKGAAWATPLAALTVVAPAYASSQDENGCFNDGTLFDAQSRARFLSGSIGGASLDLDSLVELQGAHARAFGAATEATDTAGLDVTALSAITLNATGLTGVVSDLLDLTLGQDLGVLNQYAYANEAVGDPDSHSIGSAGAVNQATGAITLQDLDPAASQMGTVDLYTLLETLTGDNSAVANLVTEISALHLDIGAVAASTTYASLCPEPTSTELVRDYGIAQLGLDLESDVVGAVLTALTSALDGVNIKVSTNALLDSLRGIPLLGPLLAGVGGLLANVDSTINVNTAQLTDAPMPASPDSALQLDLGNTAVRLNLETLLDGGLNGQAPNTRLFIDAGLVDGSIKTLVDGLLDTLLERLAAILDVNLTITVLGVVRVRVEGTLAQLLDGTGTAAVETPRLLGGWQPLLGINLGAVLAAVGGVVSGALEALFNEGGVLAGVLDGVNGLLELLLTVLQEVLRITVNAQNRPVDTTTNFVPPYYERGIPEGRYDTTALHLAVLGAVDLLDLAVGRGSVGENIAR